MISTAMKREEVTSFKARLEAQGYAIKDFGAIGFCSEVNGSQVVRATHMEGDNFLVRYNDRMFPDV